MSRWNWSQRYRQVVGDWNNPSAFCEWVFKSKVGIGTYNPTYELSRTWNIHLYISWLFTLDDSKSLHWK